MPTVSNSYYDFFDPKYVPVGFVFPFCSANFPYEFAECNGVILPKSNYERLYSTIGTMYGGVIGVSCALPDYRDYFLRCISGTSDVDPEKNNRTVGVPVGNTIGSKQNSEVRRHNHQLYYWNATLHSGTQSPGDTRPVYSNDYMTNPTSDYVKTLTDNPHLVGNIDTIPKNITVVYAMRVM